MPTSRSLTRGMAGFGVAIAIAIALGTASCYSTRALPAHDLHALQQGGRSDEVLLRAGERQQLRIRPRSWVRFQRTDGASTAWTEARNIHVTANVAILNPAAAGTPLILRWTEIAGIEVNDLDMGRTVIGVVGGTTVVILAMAAEAMIVAALSGLTNGHSGEIGLTRGALEAVVEHAGERPVDQEPTLQPSAGAGGWADAELITVGTAAAPQPLFSWQARRRDVVRLGAEIEVGLATGTAAVRPEATMTAGLRLWNVLDLGGGVAVLSDPEVPNRATDLAAASAPTPTSTPTSTSTATPRIVPLLRGGLHLDLDPAGRVAFALGEEIGFSTGGWLDLRTRWGLRFRIGDRWQLGVYPANPRTVWTSAGAPPSTALVSAFELGFSL